MSEKVGLVEYKETLSIQVGNFLIAKGFIPGNSDGCRLSTLCYMDHVGVLHKDPEKKPYKRLFGLITEKPYPDFIGVIWLESRKYNANDGNWVFNVIGRTNIQLAKNLADVLASNFNVKITLQLKCE
ncbi:MAG: hypothetical protein NTZ84_01445 [Candidatus Nealsonbacteria bacterium]|nr:hypothetical protein [Candidatus Nealsonbacteria bacterium]